MKRIAFLFLLIWQANTSFSQDILLLDKEFVWKAYLTNTINNKIAKEYFPIYKSELDSLIIKVKPLLNLTKMGLEKVYLNENNYSTGHLRFKMQNVKGAYGDRYDISLVSQIDDKEYLVRLNHPDWSLSTNRQQIKTFLHYMQKIQGQIANNKLNLFNH